MRILSTIVLLTIVMAFVWVRSSRITTSSSVHHTSGDGPVALDHGLMIVSNNTHFSQEPELVWNTTPISIQEPAGEQVLIQYPSAEHLGVTSRSSKDGAGVVLQDKQFRTGLPISKNRSSIIVTQGELIKKMPHSIYDRRGNTSTVVDENFNNEPYTSQALHKMNIR